MDYFERAIEKTEGTRLIGKIEDSEHLNVSRVYFVMMNPHFSIEGLNLKVRPGHYTVSREKFFEKDYNDVPFVKLYQNVHEEMMSWGVKSVMNVPNYANYQIGDMRFANGGHKDVIIKTVPSQEMQQMVANFTRRSYTGKFLDKMGQAEIAKKNPSMNGSCTIDYIDDVFKNLWYNDHPWRQIQNKHNFFKLIKF